MKTTPIAGPGKVQNTSNNTDTRARVVANLEAKMKPVAVAAPVEGQSAPIPVNANQVSAEEIGAIKSSTGTPDISAEAEETPEAIETAPEEPKAVEAPASSQMAILARKERALRAKAQQQDQALKAREQALKAREDAISAKDQQYSSDYVSKARIKADLLGVMAETGLSYEELTQQVINQQSENPYVKAQINKLMEANQRLEEKLAGFEKNTQEQVSSQYKAALTQIKSDVVSLVKSDPEAYEAINQTRSIQDVVDLIEETYKKDGIVMSVEEAAQEVEDYLSDEAYKLSELKKVQARRRQASTAKPSTQQQIQAPNKQPQTMKTLTNATASTRQMSAKERAILAFKGELK